MRKDDEMLEAQADLGSPVVMEGGEQEGKYMHRETKHLSRRNNPHGVKGKPEDAPLVKPEDKPLTSAQEIFAQAYARGDSTASHACRIAGYAESTVSVKGREFLDASLNPHIVKRIREIQEENAKRYGIDLDRHLRDLMTIRDQAIDNGSFAAAVSAEKIRGSAAGLHIDRKEILHGKIDQMSKADVIARLNELQEKFNMRVIEGEGERVLEDDQGQHQADDAVDKD